MAGNKTDNGVHEVGTDDIRLSYQNDTPGQDVENYIKEQEKALERLKEDELERYEKLMTKEGCNYL